MAFTKQVFVFLIFIIVALCDRQVQGLPFGPQEFIGSVVGATKGTVDKVTSLPGSLGELTSGGKLGSLLPIGSLPQLGGEGSTQVLDSITSKVTDAIGSPADSVIGAATSTVDKITSLPGSLGGLPSIDKLGSLLPINSLPQLGGGGRGQGLDSITSKVTDAIGSPVDSIVGAATSTVDKITSLPGSLGGLTSIGKLGSELPIGKLPQLGEGGSALGLDSITSKVSDAIGGAADSSKLAGLGF